MSRELRDALGTWATGVAIITARDDNGQHYGMTVNSFASVSLEPALVLWSVQQDCDYRAVFDHGYCVNILGVEQSGLVWQFTKGSQAERFDGVATHELDSGRLALAGAIGHFDCSLHQRVHAGDHDILIGQVEHFASSPGAGVLFSRGQLTQAKD